MRYRQIVIDGETVLLRRAKGFYQIQLPKYSRYCGQLSLPVGPDLRHRLTIQVMSIRGISLNHDWLENRHE